MTTETDTPPSVEERALHELERAHIDCVAQLDALAIYVRQARSDGEYAMVGAAVLTAMHEARLALDKLAASISISRQGARSQYRH